MKSTPSDRPDWDRLFETASSQQGLFTTQQALDVGFSSQLLRHYTQNRRLMRVMRGIYRLVQFPAGDQEDLVRAWLWTNQAGIVSHQSALSLHGLSDLLPAHIDITIPSGWRVRRFRVPPGIVLHHADVPEQDRSWCGAVPTTSVRRSLNDCAKSDLSPEHLRQAAKQALRRGLVINDDLADVEQALEPFGGLAA